MEVGNSASSDSICMQCVSIPDGHRRYLSIISHLTVTPPSTSVAYIFGAMNPLLLQNMKHGDTVKVIPNASVKLFVDFVGVISNTPRLNSLLDVLVHFGNSCCRLFNFRKRA